MIGVGIREDHESSGCKWPAYMRERCGMCGRFVSPNGPGVSWSQNWSTGWGGVPDLHDPAFRCSPCTDTHGIAESNCNPAAGTWSGRNPIVGSGQNLADAHSKNPPEAEHG